MPEEFAPDSRTITNGQIWELHYANGDIETQVVVQTARNTFRLINLETMNRWTDDSCFTEPEEGETWHYIGTIYGRGFNKDTHKIKVTKL
jgi:hypothetical protein